MGEFTSNFDELDEWLYFFTVMGEPSANQPWGWQLDGHHLIINYFVLGDQVVMTPTFMGSEPAIAESGKYEGVAVRQDELRSGLQLMQSLDAAQRSRALIGSAKDSNNALAEAFQDNVVLDYVGIRASELSEPQRGLLLAVILEFVGNMEDGHAKVKMEEVGQHLDQTYFAWIGASTTTVSITIESTARWFSSNSTIRGRSSCGCRGGRTSSMSTRLCGPPTATTTAKLCCACTTNRVTAVWRIEPLVLTPHGSGKRRTCVCGSNASQAKA